MPFPLATDPPPPPLPPQDRRYDDQGRPTPEMVAYEQRMLAWLKRLAASIP